VATGKKERRMSHHHHDHEVTSDLTTEQKLEKLFAHWIKHNEDHGKTYAEWMAKAEESGLTKTAKILSDVAELTAQINAKLKEALS